VSGDKHQNPNTKQPTFNPQTPIKVLAQLGWCLMFGIYLVFGVWCLVFIEGDDSRRITR
jgi:hypothetical protein